VKRRKRKYKGAGFKLLLIAAHVAELLKQLGSFDRKKVYAAVQTIYGDDQ